MNERMVEIKVLNLSLSLLYTLIFSLVKTFSYFCSLNNWCSGEAPARPPHVHFNKIHSFETR